MNNIEEKMRIDQEIETNTKKLKDLLADLDIAKKEKIALDSVKERNVSLIKEQNTLLTETINDIATQKIAWAHEKDRQEKDIDSKKKDVAVVLARSIELDKKESELKNIVSEVEAIRNETRNNKFAIEQAETAIQVVKNESKKALEEANKISKGSDDRIAKFKASVVRVLNEINTL